MMLGFRKKPVGGGLMDMIRCDERDYLIWKWHPEGTIAGQNRKENAVRWGSSLRVKTGEVAAFVYTDADGNPVDYIEGPCDTILQTENLPVISRIVGLAYAGGTPIQAEVYFINTRGAVQTRFAVPFFDVYDPRFDDFSVPVAVRGSITYRIEDYREFVRLHSLSTFDERDLSNKIRDGLARRIKPAVADAPQRYGIPVVQLERVAGRLNGELEEEVKRWAAEQFGVLISSFDIGTVEVDKMSQDYGTLMSVTRDLAQNELEAKSQLDIERVRGIQSIDIEDYGERLRIDREEDQYARRKRTQTDNLQAYQAELSAEIGIAGADALGNMGAPAGLSEGPVGGFGFNPAAVMTSMEIGSAIGKNVVGAMNSNTRDCSSQAPPPVPATVYHVARNGQATGPYTIEELAQQVRSGELTKDSLVWTTGMQSWQKASTMPMVESLFPPDVPKSEQPHS